MNLLSNGLQFQCRKTPHWTQSLYINPRKGPLELGPSSTFQTPAHPNPEARLWPEGKIDTLLYPSSHVENFASQDICRKSSSPLTKCLLECRWLIFLSLRKKANFFSFLSMSHRARLANGLKKCQPGAWVNLWWQSCCSVFKVFSLFVWRSVISPIICFVCSGWHISGGLAWLDWLEPQLSHFLAESLLPISASLLLFPSFPP